MLGTVRRLLPSSSAVAVFVSAVAMLMAVVPAAGAALSSDASVAAAATGFPPVAATTTTTTVTTAPLPLQAAPTDASGLTITGTSTVGGTLTATVIWTGDPTVAYLWKRCTPVANSSTRLTICKIVPGAVAAASYNVTAADAGSYLSVEVVAKNAAGMGLAYSGQWFVPGTPPGMPPITTTPDPTVLSIPLSRIRSVLSELGHPSDKTATAALIKNRSFRTTLPSMGWGELRVTWTTIVMTGTGRHSKRETVTVATGTAQVSETVHLTIRLTAAGRTLLEKKPSGLATTATEKFKPTGGKSWVSVTKKFSL